MWLILLLGINGYLLIPYKPKKSKTCKIKYVTIDESIQILYILYTIIDRLKQIQKQ